MTGPATCYTRIRDGVPYKQVSIGADVVFDVDKDGTILGAHTAGAADWVTSLIQLFQAGRLRVLLA